jgi:hypothetical protein
MDMGFPISANLGRIRDVNLKIGQISIRTRTEVCRDR